MQAKQAIAIDTSRESTLRTTNFHQPDFSSNSFASSLAPSFSASLAPLFAIPLASFTRPNSNVQSSKQGSLPPPHFLNHPVFHPAYAKHGYTKCTLAFRNVAT